MALVVLLVKALALELTAASIVILASLMVDSGVSLG